MAKQTLPTNFKDDIMSGAMGGKRRYNVVNNADGTISLEDATDYTQVGSTYGAAQVNAANTAINASADAGKIINDADALKAVTATGYIAGAKAVADLTNQINSNLTWKKVGSTTGVKEIIIPQNKEVCVSIHANQYMIACFAAGMDDTYYNTGYYANNEYNGMAQIHKISDTVYSLSSTFFNGNDISASTTCVWYYR